MAILNDFSDWPSLVETIYRYINNSINVFISKTPNEIVYGFTPVCATDLAFSFDFTMLFNLARINAAEVIAFAQMNALKIYDQKHQAVHF